MMAKMFYTMDEAKAALGREEEEIKQFAREGRLREFRDGTRLMFKADQVEQLKAELGAGGSDQVDLGVSDSGGLIGLVDTTGASGTSITLSESDTSHGIAGGGTAGGMRLKDDTAIAADLGLSGSLGGVPSPGRTGTGTGMSMSGISSPGTPTASGRSGAGINVLGGDEAEPVDPSAQTAISAGPSRDQYNLEAVGSGSGLLDLTRESDDTSLGAVLDEIGPGGTAAGGTRLGGTRAGTLGTPGGSGTGAVVFEDVAPPRMVATAAPVYVTAADPTAPAFGGAALAGFAALLFGMFVLISASQGVVPDFVKDPLGTMQWYIIFLIGLGAALLLWILGLVIGKSIR